MDLNPKCGAISPRPPKRTYLRGNTSYYDTQIIKIGRPVRAWRHPKYKVTVAEMGDRLATIDMGQKLGTVPLLEGELGPHVTQCGLGRGLPSYQVASGCIQPFSHNKHGQIIGAVPLGGGAGSASNTMLPGPRPTLVPSDILIHPPFRHNKHEPIIMGLCPFLERGSWVCI